MPRTELQFSKKRVRKAGELLRSEASERDQSDELSEALTIAENWRACHSYALQKATMGLRSRVLSSTGKRGDISQRLKRIVTIIDKLHREPTMKLDTMRDIAGCRAVVRSVGDVRLVQRQWQRSFPADRILRVNDYIKIPRSSGYRAVHLYVLYDELPVEVQIRSHLQHAWAITLEQIGMRLGFDLKSGRGPQEILDYFSLVAEAMAIDESGGDVSDELAEGIAAARLRIQPFLQPTQHPPTSAQ